MDKKVVFLILSVFAFISCSQRGAPVAESDDAFTADSLAVAAALAREPEPVTAAQVTLEKELTYDQHTLQESYPYNDTVRRFQWDKVREQLASLENIQNERYFWGVLQNYKNQNQEAPLVREFSRNAYNRVADTYGVERYQSVPLYALDDTVTAERYGRDGHPVYILGEEGGFVKVRALNYEEDRLVPKRYVKPIGDTIAYRHAIFVDRTNQNIATVEKVGEKWLIRSMNPATTGLHNPPYQQETPLGFFVIQEKKAKMIYLVDGSTVTGGFAPYASRFNNGGYVHGVPVNAPSTAFIEYSSTLGTTPRSHMCVRNATSHAKFIFDDFPLFETMLFVFD